MLVYSIDERIPAECITSVYRSPDIGSNGIAQMSFETRERLLSEYVPAVITGIVGEEIRVGVAVDLPILIWSEGVRNTDFRLE